MPWRKAQTRVVANPAGGSWQCSSLDKSFSHPHISAAMKNPATPVSPAHPINRRHFISCTLAGGAGLLLHSSRARAADVAPAGEKTKTKIELRSLGKTGVKLPILGMGVMRADNPNVVKAALRSGVVHFDTANGYQEGRNETMLGEIFKGVPRDTYHISTKVSAGKGPVTSESIKAFLGRFDTSLKRLGLEYVNNLYVHGVGNTATIENEELMKALATLKKQGRVKTVGVSTHSNETAVIDAMIKTKFYDTVLTTYNFKKQQADDLKGAIARAAAAGLGVVAMKTMAGAKDVNFPAALKWALQDKNVTMAIPGFTNFEQLDTCLEAVADLKYTPEEKAFIDQAAAAGAGKNPGNDPGKKSRKGKKVASLFCLQCGQCDGQCPQNLPIPDLMRSYMYAYGYRHPALAQETLAELTLPANPCAGCDTCTVDCRSGFDVGAKIKNIARLRAVPSEFLV